ncbi:PAAR domain-containing protein [Pseudocitrobacter faecalis]|uniref:PAAR domain-containing protein n=1 Tax=Pseudocitrobacter faecalis TaxID=1398493 RepID=UPI003899F47B
MSTAARLSDKGTWHDGYYETAIIAGSSTVFIAGLPAARAVDTIDCGGVVIGGGTVNIG